MEDQYDSKKNYTGTVFNDFAYTSWGEKSNAATYDNIGDFFKAETFRLKVQRSRGYQE